MKKGPGAVLQRDGGDHPANMLFRDLACEVRAEAVDIDARTIELSFSSDVALDRWFGIEILDHRRGSVRLDRLNNAAALLMDHNHRDMVGVVEKAWVKGGRGYAIVRFGKSARAEEIFNDVRDGIRKLVSVAYIPHEVRLEGEKDGKATYRLVDWEPYEISLVSVPADASVGIGRQDGQEPFDIRTLIKEEENDMTRTRNNGGAGAPAVETPSAPAAPAAPEQLSLAPAVPAAPAAPAFDAEAVRTEERARAANIRALASRVGATDLGEQAVAAGRSLDQFVAELTAAQPNAAPVRTAETPVIGLNEGERQRYSMVRLMNALANPTDRRAQEAARFEFECSEAARAARPGNDFKGEVTVPVDVLRGRNAPAAQRDLTVGTATAGGNTVATDLITGDFIEMLRNRMALRGLGVRMLADLAGNVAIPRQTGGATAYWVGEGSSPTEGQQAFDQVAMTPKTVGAFTDISRKLLLQSSIDVESFVRGDLATVLALAIDLAGINGSGSSNQPRGVMNTSGIGSVEGGTNGAAPTNSHIIKLETEVAIDNADVGTLGYLTNAKVRGKLKETERFTGTNGNPVWADDNRLNGYNAAVSNQVPSDLVKGSSGAVCSAILFGNWADLIIGMWGGLDLMVDPYTGSTSGTVRIVALQDVDVAVRQAASFAAMVDALTT